MTHDKDAVPRDVKGNGLILRYTPNERTNHWITAITFILLALSGLAMFHPAMSWLYALLGGGQWTRILHPFIGCVMFLSFLILALRFWHHNYLEKSDVQWMRQIGDVLNNREEKLPAIGKVQRGPEAAVLHHGCVPLLLLASGIVIWRRYFSFYFPIEIIRLAALVHAAAAFVLIVGIVVHIYAALWIKGSIGAMTRGTVTYGWAKKHHPRWFKEIIGK